MENELNYMLFMISRLNELDVKVHGFWIKAIRILLSYFVKKEIVSEYEFELLIRVGIGKGFLEKVKKDDGKYELLLTDIGRVHLTAIEQTLKYRNEIEQQIRKIYDSRDDYRNEYLKELQETLKSTIEYSDKRRFEYDHDELKRIYVNSFLGRVEGEVWFLSITNKEYQTKRDFSGRGTLINSLLRNLVNNRSKDARFKCIHLGYDKAVIIINNVDKSIIERVLYKIKELNFQIVDGPKKVFIKDVPYLQDFIFSEIIDYLINRKKLAKSGNKIIDLSSKQLKRVEIGGLKTNFTIFDGVTINVSLIGNGDFIIQIDPTYIEVYTLEEWIKSQTSQDIESIKRNIPSVRVLPSRKSAYIKDLFVEKDVPKYIISHWEQKYKMPLNSKKGYAEIIFKDPSKSYIYPLETICLPRSWIEKNIGYIVKEEVTYPPYIRYQKILNFYSKYLADEIQTDFCKIKIIKRLTLFDLLDKNYFRYIYSVSPPYLIFSKVHPTIYRDTDTRAIFKFGGYSGRRNVTIYKIICPHYITLDDIRTLLNNLKREYDKVFGELEYLEPLDDVIIYYTDEILRYNKYQLLEYFTNKISVHKAPENTLRRYIVLVLEPGKEHFIYYAIKKIISEEWGIPDQHIKESTLNKVLNNDLSVIRGLALQIYIKSLKFDEPAWLLEKPIDLRAIYCGIGYSQRAENDVKKAVGVVAVYDARGNNIVQKHIKLSKVSPYLSRELISRVLSFIQGQLPSQMSVERMVIYKKKHLNPNERNYLKDVIDDLKKLNIWKGIKIDFVTIEDSTFRLFKIRNAKLGNVEPGLILIKNDREAMMVASGHPELGIKQGTVKVISLKVEYKESQLDIRDIATEYYDRTFLNWMSPIMISKYTPELNISVNIANILKEVEIDTDFTYTVV